MIFRVSLPNRVLIARDEDYRTHTIGLHAGGQFFASIRDTRAGWYAYLHLFDHFGRHSRSLIRRVPSAAQLVETLAGLLSTLDGMRFGDIAIRPFRLEYDGVLFGLVDESDEERGDWAELYPDRLAFQPPWDGTYST